MYIGNLVAWFWDFGLMRNNRWIHARSLSIRHSINLTFLCIALHCRLDILKTSNKPFATLIGSMWLQQMDAFVPLFKSHTKAISIKANKCHDTDHLTGFYMTFMCAPEGDIRWTDQHKNDLIGQATLRWIWMGLLSHTTHMCVCVCLSIANVLRGRDRQQTKRPTQPSKLDWQSNRAKTNLKHPNHVHRLLKLNKK